MAPENKITGWITYLAALAVGLAAGSRSGA